MAKKKEETSMLDPVAYRSDYNPNNIKEEYRDDPNIPGVGPQNANLNYQEYGDDSNPEWQSQRGGLNPKYEGEGVSNTYIEYDPNLRTSDLDPNYLYGENARQQNRQEAGYIARRNDQIASALYNEGLTSRADVENYLSQQGGWMDSTLDDRLNTIDSIWKRMGQITPKEENNEVDYSRLDNIRGEDTSGKLYGKTTADEGNPEAGIDTLSDANSVYKMMQDATISEVKTLLGMSTDAIAASIWGGVNPASETAMREYQALYPELWNEVQTKVKKYKGQEAINAITHGSADYATSEVESKEKNLENDKRNKADSVATSSEESDKIIQDLNNDLSSNAKATTAEETMANLTDEMNKLKTRLKNLNKEANQIFKGDAPDYIVKAYINNRTQEINDRLKELQYDYDAAYQRNRDAIDDAWKQKEYNLKVEQLQIQKDNAAWDKYYQQYQMAKDNIIKTDDGKLLQLQQGSDGKWYYTEIQGVKTYEGSGMKGAGFRNNNPGNITDGSFGNVIGFDDRGFAIFATPEDGFDALVEKVIYNQTNPNSVYYGMTLLQYFNKYAPKLDRNGNPTGNDPDGRAANAAKQLGVSVNTPISEIDPLAFAIFIAKTDSGYDYSTYGKFRKSKGAGTFDENSIEVPDEVYRVNDGYKEWKVDPNSDEGKKLAAEYRARYAQENGLDIALQNTRGSDLIGSDGIDHAYEIISDDGETPVAYRQILYNLVPTKLKDNVAELEKIYNTAREMYKKGVPADEAAMLWYGIDPITDDKTGLLSDIYLLARTAGAELSETFFGDLGVASRSGDPIAMVGFLENSILPEAAFNRETDYDYIIGQIQALESILQSKDGQDFINAATSWEPDDAPVGFYRATINDILNTYVKSKPQYQEIATRIDGIIASMLTRMANGDFTDKQISLMENYLPSRMDFLDSLEVKLSVAKENLLQEVNTVRKRYRLPLVDEYSLRDMGLRAESYKEYANSKREQYESENGYKPNLN